MVPAIEIDYRKDFDSVPHTWILKVLQMYKISPTIIHFLTTSTGFDLTTRDSYFTIIVEVFANHILAGNIYFTNHIQWIEHKIMLKLANNYQIIQQCHNFKNTLIKNFQHHPFLCPVKVLLTSFSQTWECQIAKTRQLAIRTIIYSFDLLWCQKSIS